MEQSFWFMVSAGQYIPCALWNYKFRYVAKKEQSLVLSSARSIRCKPCKPNFLIYILIINSFTYSYSKWLISFRFPPIKPLYESLFSPTQATCRDHLVRITNYKGFYFEIFPPPCHVLLLRPKHLPQQLVLEYPQPIFFSEYDIRSLTSIQNNRPYYSSTHVNGRKSNIFKAFIGCLKVVILSCITFTIHRRVQVSQYLFPGQSN